MVKKKSSSKKPKKIPGVIKAISIIDYIYGISLIIGSVLFFLGGTLLTFLKPMRNLLPTHMLGNFMGIAFIFGAFLFLALGILYLFLGKAIKEYKLWAKIVQVILALLELFSFPIGTAIGIFILWVLLLKDETKNLFH